MIGKFLEFFMRNPRRGHEELFECNQGVLAERHLLEVSKDAAVIGREKLETLARVLEASKEFEGGDEVLAAAAQAYREGMAALLATPLHLFPDDREIRRAAMGRPSEGSTALPNTPVDGLTDGSSRASSFGAEPDAPSLEPPRRGRGRPKGSRNKPKSTGEGAES
jgi:hypothetical protein